MCGCQETINDGLSAIDPNKGSIKYQITELIQTNDNKMGKWIVDNNIAGGIIIGSALLFGFYKIIEKKKVKNEL